jgi:tRNA(adenine34) deaminase
MNPIYTKLALSLAETAADFGEVPVGAVIAREDEVISTGFNAREYKNDPLAHAEMIALHKASQVLSSWRLSSCSLYVTMEPCIMCTGALLQARIKDVYFCTRDPKGGAVVSLYSLNTDDRLNHRFPVYEGEGQLQAQTLLKNFFQKLRDKA